VYTPIMDTSTFVISFPETSADLGNLYADELKQELIEVDPTVRIDKRRDKINAQDLGATLVLILGTGAITTLAKGLSSWIARNSGVRVVIKTPDGTILADHLDSKDAQQVVASIFSKKAK
jgi:hypothetical protein